MLNRHECSEVVTKVNKSNKSILIHIKKNSLCLVMAFIISLIYANIAEAQSWYDSSWSCRKKITIQHTNVDSDLSDFPLYVKINSDSDIGANAQADGDDIRFTLSDGVTLLSHEEESFSVSSGTATGHFWVKVPTVDSDADTDIFIYYGNSAASDGQDANGVWSDAVGVWHLDESSGYAIDSSDSENDGTPSAYGIIQGHSTAKVNKSIYVDGGAVEIGTPSEMNLSGAFSICAWVRTSTTSGYRTIFAKRSSTAAAYQLRMNDGGALSFSIHDSSLNSDTIVGNSTLPTYTWQFVVGTRGSDKELNIYLNGVSDATSVSGTHDPDTSTGVNTAIGRVYVTNYPFMWWGYLDEVMVFNRELSADEIKFIYYNQKESDNELTWGSESSGTSELPGFHAPLLNEPTDPSVFQALVGTTGSSQGPKIDDPEIKALAKALKYDPALMYQFVYNYIDLELTWGDVKGPYMTWMDRSGNAFDQASLLIALLEEAETNCTTHTVSNPQYVVGEIELDRNGAVPMLNVSEYAPSAEAELARAGIYADLTPGDFNEIGTVNLEHVWVKVTIDGQTYKMDPSLKNHTAKNGIPPAGIGSSTLKSIMEYVNSPDNDFLDDAMEGATSSSTLIKELNEANIKSHLNTYTSNLIADIKENKYWMGFDDFLGSWNILPKDINSMPPSTLPYTVVSEDDIFSIDSVPDLYRTTLRIQYCGIDKEMFSSDIYGRRLTLNFNGSNQPVLLLDGSNIDTGSAVTAGQSYPLTFIVDHPYPTDDFDAAVTTNVTAGGFYQIVNGWGDTGVQILKKHRANLQKSLFDGASESSEEVLGESYAIVGLTWLTETSRMRSIAEEIPTYYAINKNLLENHHMIGITGQYDSPYIDMPLGHLGVYDYYDANALFLTVTNHASAYEHQVITQLQDVNAVSTVSLLGKANFDGNDIYIANESNWSSIESLLTDYSQEAKDLASAYIANGFTIHIPEHGSLDSEDWSGMGFEAIYSDSNSITASYIISGGYSGGSSAPDTALSPSKLFDCSEIFGGESTAAYATSVTDIGIGSGGFPFGLAFSRYYSSAKRLEDGPLGLGWSHNYDITVKEVTNSFKTLGMSSLEDAAAQIVSLYITYDILKGNHDSASRNVIAAITQNWLTDQMKEETVVIDNGGSKISFLKDPNGTYIAPAGSNLKLELYNGNYRLKNSGGIFYDFDSEGRLSQWSDAHGNVVNFNYDNGKLDSVESVLKDEIDPLVSLEFTFSGDHLTQVTDSAGRSVSYEYDANELITYTRIDGNDITYEYDDVNDGQLTKVYLPKEDEPYKELFITNVYDVLGNLRQKIDVNDNVWDFYYAYYRSETMEPAQLDPNDEMTRYSTVSWAYPSQAKTLSIDQLGRQSYSYFDSDRVLSISVGASGASVETEADKFGNIIASTVVSSNPLEDESRSTSYSYETFESETTGRMFMKSNASTGIIGTDTIYVYDYDDPIDSNEVGNLIRVIEPNMLTNKGVKKPTTEYRYNKYGQLIKTEDPNGVVTKYEYYPADEGARLKKTISDVGHSNISSEVEYDIYGNVVKEIDPLGRITRYQYSPSGLLKKVNSPAIDANEVTYEYDINGRLLDVKQQTATYGLLHLQTITYTDRGQQKTVRGPYADSNDTGINLTTYQYDSLGRTWKVTDAEGHTTETRYCPDGQTWKVIDPNGDATMTYVYNSDGSVDKILDAEGKKVTEYEYNGFGEVTSVDYMEAYDGNDITIYRDEFGRTVGIDYPDLDDVNHFYLIPNESYDPNKPIDANNLEYIVDVYQYYNDYGQVVQSVTPENTVSYVYDIYGRTVEVTDNQSTTKTYYNRLGNVVQIDTIRDQNTKTIKYGYDNHGKLNKLTYPDGTYVTYAYDYLDRLTSIRDVDNNDIVTYSFDELSRRQALAYANGTSVQYGYDIASRLLKINNLTNSGQSKYEYTYDKVGMRQGMLVNDIDEHIYHYDNTYKLIDVNYPIGYESLAYDTTFNYDKVGNRTSVIDDKVTNYVTNEMNQYITVGQTGYEYDARGNLTFDGFNTYHYNAENKMDEAVNVKGSYGNMLNKALENRDIEFSTTMMSGWSYTEDESYDSNDGDCAVSDEGTSYMEATVFGKGLLQFKWKTSVQNSGTIFLYVDGVQKQSTYIDSWSNAYQSISTFGLHTIKWEHTGQGVGYLDKVEWIPSSSTPVSLSLQQALDMGWDTYTYGDENWLQTSTAYYGNSSARSGYNLDDEESSKMEVRAEGEGIVSFYWKVSSQQDFDYLRFYIDGEPNDQISGEENWRKKTIKLEGEGTHSLLWEYVKDGSTSEGSDCGWVDHIQGPGITPPAPAGYGLAALDTYYLEHEIGYGWSGVGSGGESYYGGDSLQVSGVPDGYWTDFTITVNAANASSFSFYWKVSSQQNSDYLRFYIDDEEKTPISGEVDWTKVSYDLPSGTHVLKWRYQKDESGSSPNDCAWIDYFQWSKFIEYEESLPWQKAEYEYDAAGRRISKTVDDDINKIKYFYDGDQIIAEYDFQDNLIRKFVYGPGIDQPVCMINVNVEDANGTYYYHFDGLGSVVAMSDEAGIIAEKYFYDAYGLPAVQAGACVVGNTQIFANAGSSTYRTAMPFTMEEDGIIESVTVYHEGGSGNMLVAVYSNSSNLPGYLLGVSEATAVNSEEGWQTVRLKDMISVKDGETIWLAWVFENTVNVRNMSGTPGRAVSGQSWASGMPSDFGASTTGSTIYSIYADYIPTNVVGITTVYSSTDTSTDRRAVPYTMTTEDGTLNSISIYHNGGSGDMLLAVYSDDGSGKPQYRLAVSEETAVNSTAGWQTIELIQPILAEKDTTIWLSWVFESNPGVRYTAGTPGRAASGQAWAYGMPATFGSSTVASYKYSICANYTVEDDAPQITLIGNPYMYTARAYDIETGLYYYRARYYNPHIGRFLQVDPAGQGMNWYAYCGNNPFNFTDPSGQFYISPIYPMPDKSFSIEVSCKSITDKPIKDDVGAYAAVLKFFTEAGFFVQYKGWDLDYVKYKEPLNPVSDGNYACYFSTDNDKLTIPEFSSTTMRALDIIMLDGKGLLDKRALNIIFKDDLINIHSWVRPSRGGLLNYFAYWAKYLIFDNDSAFKHTPVSEWLYGGKIYNRSSINYYLEGYGMAKFGIPLGLGIYFVYQWKTKAYGHEPLLEDLHWWGEGYNDYIDSFGFVYFSRSSSLTPIIILI